MSYQEPATKADHLPTSSPETAQPPQIADELPTTSHVIKNAPQHLKPTMAVACMNCPLAVWILQEERTLECYCRTLYMTVWETHKHGTISMCDAPEQAAAAAKDSN
ncbi:hypothetical protein GALL_446870 [mine drainage metagenome]|uniref:Uncharacterized protein n=1 Tax=mine drainage metagenome TaxID=410659 RepID=A0A1J5PQ95_9ZZZZ